MKPKVSVIIPCYNVENYLRQCLDSVVNQTLKEIEIICIDDGSTDYTLDILEEYASKDSRFKIIKQQNGGPGQARNAGLDIATGEYVSMLDSDDYFELNMLEKFYNTAVSKDTDIILCAANDFNDEENKHRRIRCALVEKYLPFKKIFNYKDMPKYIFNFCIGWAWDKFYKKSFIDKYNLRYAQLKNSEDLTFVFLSLVLAKKISVLNEILISHRKRSGSVEVTRENNPYDFIFAATKLRNDLINYGKYEEVEQSFVNWFVPFAYWYCDTLKTDIRKEVCKELEKVFTDFNLYSKEKSYFFDKNTYYRLSGEEYAYFSFLERLFSIKNSISKKYKIITFLGISFRFKRKNK